jgi:hypothetical protein
MRLKTARRHTLLNFGCLKNHLFTIKIMLPAIDRSIVNVIVIIRGAVLAQWSQMRLIAHATGVLPNNTLPFASDPSTTHQA